MCWRCPKNTWMHHISAQQHGRSLARSHQRSKSNLRSAMERLTLLGFRVDTKWPHLGQVCTTVHIEWVDTLHRHWNILKYSEMNHKNESYFFKKKHGATIVSTWDAGCAHGPIPWRKITKYRDVPRCAESRSPGLFRTRGYGGYGEWTTEIGEHKKTLTQNVEQNVRPVRTWWKFWQWLGLWEKEPEKKDTAPGLSAVTSYKQTVGLALDADSTYTRHS